MLLCAVCEIHRNIFQSNFNWNQNTRTQIIGCYGNNCDVKAPVNRLEHDMKDRERRERQRREIYSYRVKPTARCISFEHSSFAAHEPGRQ
jgi:fido (protein-threonine AMPylation protein)